MSLQIGRLDLGVDDSEVGRLSSNGTAVLLRHSVAATKYNGLGALLLVHSDLGQLVQKHFPVHEREKKTYREQGAGRSATTIPNDNNLLGVEKCLGRGL